MAVGAWPRSRPVADGGRRRAPAQVAERPRGPAIGSAPDRKLAGILAEADWPASSAASWPSRPSTDALVVVVGIGLNVNWPDRRCPPTGRHRRGAQPRSAGRVPVEREQLLVASCSDLDALVRRRSARPDGAGRGCARAVARPVGTLGRRVRVDLGARRVDGAAVDLDRRPGTSWSRRPRVTRRESPSATSSTSATPDRPGAVHRSHDPDVLPPAERSWGVRDRGRGPAGRRRRRRPPS